jgi:hypothetical protein
VSSAAITLRVASQRVFIVVVYFVIDSVRKLLDTASYVRTYVCMCVRADPYIKFTCGSIIPERHENRLRRYDVKT